MLYSTTFFSPKVQNGNVHACVRACAVLSTFSEGKGREEFKILKKSFSACWVKNLKNLSQHAW